jgi:cell division protein FtsW (lipid II flippase)
MQILTKSKRNFSIDWKIFLPSVILSILGIVTLVSTELSEQGGIEDWGVIQKQILFVVVGIIIFIIPLFYRLSYLKHGSLYCQYI